MRGQVFHKPVPQYLLWQFLQTIQAYDYGSYLVVCNDQFKRAKLQNVLNPFLVQMQDYYLPSKRHFIDKTMSFYKLMTILRQICNANGIVYERKMKYVKSSYEILYHLYRPVPAETSNLAAETSNLAAETSNLAAEISSSAAVAVDG